MLVSLLTQFPPVMEISSTPSPLPLGALPTPRNSSTSPMEQPTSSLNATHLQEVLLPAWADLLTTILKGFIFGTIIISAVLGNALVIISVHRHRKLRVITNYYVVSLAMADMLVALCAMTFNASVELSGRWMFGYFMCDVWNSLDVYFSTASILHLCCISVDRYYAIVRPLEYPITMTHRTVVFMLANVWLLPALISFTPIFLGWYTTEEHQKSREANPDSCVFVVNKVYAIVSSCVSFWIPGIVMITMYYRIYKEAIRQRKALSRTSSNILLNAVHLQHTSHAMHHSHHYLHPSDGDIGLTIQQIRQHVPGNVSPNYSTFTETIEESRADDVPISDPVVNFSDSVNIMCLSDKEVSPHKSVNISCDTTSSGYYSSYGGKRNSSFVGVGAPHRNSRQSTSSASTAGGATLQYRDYCKAATELNTNGTSIRQQAKSWKAEHKAARTLGIIMGVFLICWLPFFLWYVITSLCGDSCHCPDVVIGMLFWIGYFNSALNPVIYAYFNRDFRDAFRSTLQCAFPCLHCWKAHTTQYV